MSLYTDGMFNLLCVLDQCNARILCLSEVNISLAQKDHSVSSFAMMNVTADARAF